MTKNKKSTGKDIKALEKAAKSRRDLPTARVRRYRHPYIGCFEENLSNMTPYDSTSDETESDDIWEKVDEVLDGDDMNAVIHQANVRNSANGKKKKATTITKVDDRRSSASKPKEDSQSRRGSVSSKDNRGLQVQHSSPLRRNNDQADEELETESDDDDDDDDELEGSTHKPSPSSHNSRNQKPTGSTFHDTKEANRKSDADNRSNKSSSTSKLLKQAEERLRQERDKCKEKDAELENLGQNYDLQREENEKLVEENRRTKELLAKIRAQPELLLRKSSGKGQKRKAHDDSEDDDDKKFPSVKDPSMKPLGMVAVKQVFRVIKFIGNKQQENQFCEMVMDAMDKKELTLGADLSEEDKEQVKKARKRCYNLYRKDWLRYMNDDRTYTQQRAQDRITEYMAENNLETLPDTLFLRQNVLPRDFSMYEIQDDDDDETKAEKQANMQTCKDLMDLYTDIIVPAVAGAKLFHPGIRHFEPMSQSLMPNSNTQLRITASTEAMACLTYINGRQKWIATTKFRKEKGPKAPLPRYFAKYPERNKEFQTPYTENDVGQARWGGWNIKSKKMYAVLQREVIKYRTENKERILKVEQECCARLQEKFSETHKRRKLPKKKQQANPALDEDEDPDLVYMVEV